MRLTGFSDTTPGHVDFEAGSIEHALLAPRQTANNSSSSEKLTDIMKFLLPHAQLLPHPVVGDILDSWIDDVLPMVRDWLDRLVEHVLEAYLLKHH